MCFVRVHVQTHVLQHLEDCAYIALVVICSVRPNHYVVKIDVTEFADELVKCSHYSSLMYGWGILKSHWHDQPFIKTQWDVNGCQVYMIRMHSSLKKTVCHIYCHPYLAFSTIIENVINLR